MSNRPSLSVEVSLRLWRTLVHYDLTDLRLFLNAVSSGSFSAGARKANISVSALSERMKALEEETGTALFTRKARGSELTAAGREFAEHARAVLMQTERLEGAVAAWRNRIAGSVNLMTNSNAMSAFLPEVLARFLARYPDIDLTIREAQSDDIVDAVRAGEADIGVVAGTANLDGLHVVPFRTDRLVLLVPAGHRLAGRRRVTFREVVDEPFASLNEDAAIEKYLSMQAARLGKTMKSRIRLRSFDSIARVVAANAGVAILPASIASSPQTPIGVHIVEFSDDWAIRNLVICRQPGETVRLEIARLEAELAAESSA
jgi:DNA-binding transcriptional LysR family regulator